MKDEAQYVLSGGPYPHIMAMLKTVALSLKGAQEGSIGSQAEKAISNAIRHLERWQ